MRYFTALSFKGTNYHGWQIQPNAESVQSVLNKAFTTVLNESIELTGAGRTDTGVHARKFIAHFDTAKSFDNEKLVYRLNSLLPADIAIHEIFPVKSDVHARFTAISRTYEYHICRRKNPFLRELARFYHFPVNVELMNESARIFFNYSDFTSFSKLHTDTKTNLCKIYHAEWVENGDLLIFTIKANRFLRNMVRAIVGTLLEIGRNKLTINDLKQIIENKNRCDAGMSVPAEGLYLTDIEYPDDIRL